MEKNTDKTRGYKVQPSFKLGTYRALKQEAENEGRSLANMVERLVEQALDMRATRQQ
ncbi:hypothetical protein KZ326_08515 [Glaesserella parasuis]|nr:hypothetical protein [Glaesserella parasuis]